MCTERARLRTKLFTLPDIAVAIIVIAAAAIALIFLRSGEGCVATVEYDGKTVYTVELSSVTDERIFTVNGDIAVEIIVAHGKIGFASSECADKTCVRFGMLSQKGQIAVCLPARVSIRISGGKAAADAVTG